MKNEEERQNLDFEVEVCDVSHCEACVMFYPPYTLTKRFIESYEVKSMPAHNSLVAPMGGRFHQDPHGAPEGG